MTSATLVIDFGSHTIKAGLATANKPELIIPSAYPENNVKHPINAPIPADAKIKYAVSNGEIASKERIQFIIGSIFDHFFGTDDTELEDLKVVFTETPFSSLEHITYLSDLSFDLLAASAISIKPQAYLTGISYSLNTCLCLDIGHDVMQCIPISNGYVIPQAIHRSCLAGHSLDLFTARCTLEMDSFDTYGNLQKVQNAKIKSAQVAMPNLHEKIKSVAGDEDLMFNLTCGETLFIPKLNEQSALDPDNPKEDPEVNQFMEALSVQEIVKKSIEASDLTLRRDLWKNIIVTGGTSLLKGFRERLENELAELNPSNNKPRIFYPEDPIISSWKGAALSAKFDADVNWITAEQYKEDPKCIFEKFRLFGTSFAPPK